MVKLPFSFYECFERILPDAIIKRSDFVSINCVESEARTVSYVSSNNQREYGQIKGEGVAINDSNSK